MSLAGRVEALQSRHAALQGRIDAESARQCPDALALRGWKLEKLAVKEALDAARGRAGAA